jgi:hypothetical protein
MTRQQRWRQKNRDADLARKREDHRKNPEKQMVRGARKRAKAAGVPCTITAADIHIPMVCPALGVPLAIGDEGWTPNSPSLDRVRPELGYVPGNVVVISHRANAIKQNASLEELRRVAEWFSALSSLERIE